MFLWIYLATSVKRLHDRDKSGWWIVPFFALPCLYSQFGDRTGDWLGEWAAMLLGLIAFVFSVWGFVEMYCLRGTTRDQPVRRRPAGADRYAARLGPAERDRNGAVHS